MPEINVVIIETKDGREVCAFSDPERAVQWFKDMLKYKPSIHAVEVDSIENFLYVEDEE